MTIHTTFRDLYHYLMDEHAGRQHWNYLSLDILLAWSERLLPLMQHLERYRFADGRHLVGDAIEEDLWDLYALSRVNDYLLMPFQPENPNALSIPLMPNLSAIEYQTFWESLGMQVFHFEQFHPFYHEIANVLQADDPDEPLAVAELLWPGLMFGDLLIARAGAIVWGGINQVRADIAPHSCLYWAHQRRYRCTDDLSMGWGHNSQWRTSFRRDYRDDHRFYYHVDGTLDVWKPSARPTSARDGLSPQQRFELLRNRCFVISEMPSGGWWPYDDTAVEAN